MICKIIGVSSNLTGASKLAVDTDKNGPVRIVYIMVQKLTWQKHWLETPEE